MENTRFRIETTGFDIFIPAEELPTTDGETVTFKPNFPAGLGVDDIVGKIIYVEGTWLGGAIKAAIPFNSATLTKTGSLVMIRAWTSATFASGISYEFALNYITSGGASITAKMVR